MTPEILAYRKICVNFFESFRIYKNFENLRINSKLFYDFFRIRKLLQTGIFTILESPERHTHIVGFGGI
jgi:hypothetical protein